MQRDLSEVGKTASVAASSIQQHLVDCQQRDREAAADRTELRNDFRQMREETRADIKALADTLLAVGNHRTAEAAIHSQASTEAGYYKIPRMALVIGAIMAITIAVMAGVKIDDLFAAMKG